MVMDLPAPGQDLEELCVCDLALALGISEVSVSNTLRMLRLLRCACHPQAGPRRLPPAPAEHSPNCCAIPADGGWSPPPHRRRTPWPTPAWQHAREPSRRRIVTAAGFGPADRPSVGYGIR
jgi:hypothetical protein